MVGTALSRLCVPCKSWWWRKLRRRLIVGLGGNWWQQDLATAQARVIQHTLPDRCSH